MAGAASTDPPGIALAMKTPGESGRFHQIQRLCLCAAADRPSQDGGDCMQWLTRPLTSAAPASLPSRLAHGQGNTQVWWVALDVRCIVAQQLCGGLVDMATRLIQNAARHACSQAQRDPGFDHAGPPLLYTTSARLRGCLAIAGLGLWRRLGVCWRRHLGQVLHGQVKP